MRYSIIVPVYNRPDEVSELLQSLSKIKRSDFEVLIVEDGSSVPCVSEVERYADELDVRYFTKPNSGPGDTRNFAAARARGQWLIFLDSDVVVPQGYLDAVDKALSDYNPDAFGGPDMADASFTPVQKAINFAMTSFLTTGGIRGGAKKLDKFYPRSFNMGVKAELFKRVGGFSAMRFGEDIDLSIRLFEAGSKVILVRDAAVWHKRRTDFRKFFRQVHNSGIARINLYKKHPDSLKPVHLLPSLFTVGVAVQLVASVVLALFSRFGWALVCLCPIVIYAAAVALVSCVKNRSINVGLLSVPASFIQLTGYGSGFLRAWWRRCVKGQDEFSAFEKNFYK